VSEDFLPVHRVPNDVLIVHHHDGSFTLKHPDGAMSNLAACPPSLVLPSLGVGHGPAWIVDAVQQTPVSFTYFSTNFSVPTAPTHQGAALLYYWPGLEDSSMDDVLQPVLQFGLGPEGGGNYWVYQTWFVTSSGSAIVGDQIGPLTPGTQLNGYVELNAGRSSYAAVGTVRSTGKKSSLTLLASKTQMQPRAYLCVEIYGIDDQDCLKTPPDQRIEFRDLSLKDTNGREVSAAMVKEIQHQVCNHNVVPAGKSVTITWKSS